MLGECDAWFSRAAAVDASSPEPLQGLANVKLQGGDTEGARELMTRSLELWAPDCLAEESTAATDAGAAGSSETAMQSDEGAGAAAATVAATALGSDPPSFEMRIEAAKLLLEVGMYYAARRVLHGLIAENDAVFDAWCLLGLAHVHCGKAARGEGEGGQAAAKEAAGAARECAERARAVMGADFVEQTGAMLTALIEDADALCPDHGGDDMES